MGTPVYALTLIEIVVWGVVIVVALAMVAALIRSLGGAGSGAIRGRITTTWATAPAVVPAGGSATFVLESQVSRGGGPAPDVGRAFTFVVLPPYLKAVPASGKTDVSGTITVTVSAPADVPAGTGGTLTATETASGNTERVTFTVQ